MHFCETKEQFCKTIGHFLENIRQLLENKMAIPVNKRALLENKGAVPGNKRAILENKGATLGIKGYFQKVNRHIGLRARALATSPCPSPLLSSHFWMLLPKRKFQKFF